MTEKQAIWKSILHWRRMIKWVEKQPRLPEPSRLAITKAVGEWWGSTDCPLCSWIGTDKDCEDVCPLDKKYGNCDDDRSKNEWLGVHFSGTWEGWLHFARRLLKQLESLRGK